MNEFEQSSKSLLNKERIMNKKEYIKPRLTVIKVTAYRLMVGSQFDTPVYDPDDEVDAGDAL